MNAHRNSAFAALPAALAGAWCALLCGLMLLGAAPAWAACTPAPANLVSWWPAEGNAKDIVSSNNGTLQNGATFGGGKVGQAFSLDGVNDTVDIGDLSQLQNATGLTVLAWVNKTDNSNPVAGFVGKWDGSGSPDNTFLLYNGEGAGANKGAAALQFDDGTIGGVGGATTIPTGQWVLVAATWRSSDGRITLYKNGVTDGTATGGAGRTLKYHTAYTAKIGEWGTLHSQAFKFKGRLDEVMLYNRAMSQAEIQAIFSAGIDGVCQSPLAKVTTTANSGVGSLRGAISYANGHAGADTISFAMALIYLAHKWQKLPGKSPFQV